MHVNLTKHKGIETQMDGTDLTSEMESWEYRKLSSDKDLKIVHRGKKSLLNNSVRHTKAKNGPQSKFHSSRPVCLLNHTEYSDHAYGLALLIHYYTLIPHSKLPKDKVCYSREPWPS